MDPVSLTRTLVDIDSTTGREGEAGRVLAGVLRGLGYTVTEQPVRDDRFNVFAHTRETPRIVFSTHFDCVPPFFPSRAAESRVVGRGSCDAKGILAAQVAAAERLRAQGEARFGLLFVVGEERGSDGAKTANDLAPPGVEFLINGEPTDNRLGAATRGTLRVRLGATGRAAHSSFPELGESAIDKLIDVLIDIRKVDLPSDSLLGRTNYSIGLIEGGVAPNVISPHASAELMFRIVSDAEAVRDVLRPFEKRASVEQVAHVPAVKLHTVPGFETAVFPYTTDIPYLNRWGTPLLLGPGSIHVAHTDDEFLEVDELLESVERYVALATHLLR